MEKIMNLKDPVTVTPPSMKRVDGSWANFNPITLNKLDFILIDNPKDKKAIVNIRPFPLPLVLWEGAAYEAAGDYTQLMIENKIKELLGNDPKVVLQGLFGTPPLPPQGN